VVTFDDFKVMIASVAGLGNWLVELELVLQITISLASLFYIVLKIKEQLERNRRQK
jgi:hypothetical protein|tara:strand:- start:11093 stop:11260 length:168 start_codon:yes stop_codon:yes gene_type:complete